MNQNYNLNQISLIVNRTNQQYTHNLEKYQHHNVTIKPIYAVTLVHLYQHKKLYKFDLKSHAFKDFIPENMTKIKQLILLAHLNLINIIDYNYQDSILEISVGITSIGKLLVEKFIQPNYKIILNLKNLFLSLTLLLIICSIVIIGVAELSPTTNNLIIGAWILGIFWVIDFIVCEIKNHEQFNEYKRITPYTFEKFLNHIQKKQLTHPYLDLLQKLFI